MPPQALFRSEEMSLIQLYIPMEVSQPCIASLGDLGKVQFRDLNPEVNAFQRSFVNEIRRLDEMERQCSYFRQQIQRADIPFRSTVSFGARARSTLEIDNLQEVLREHEHRLLELTASYERLQKHYLHLTELRHVLRETAGFFDEAKSQTEPFAGQDFLDDSIPLLDDDEENANFELRHLSIGFVTGVIDRTRRRTLERVLWRSLRGNLLMSTSEIDEPIVDVESDDQVDKDVFAVFAHGREILNKVRRISESLGATLYAVDESEEKRRDSLLQVSSRIEDMNNVLGTTNQTRRAELAAIAEHLNAWLTITRKEKAIYHTMNLFNYDAGRKCLIAEGWCPSFDIPLIQQTLKDATDASGTSLSAVVTELRTNKKPPTYQRTNKFTEGFQAIIDAYGVARYREVNPGIFTLISFPFLFAVMFGDIGHGLLMFLAALYLVMNEKKLASNTGEIFSMFFGGRYMMLMMGAFSIFTGVLYNDIFSLSLSSFTSGFDWPTEFNSTDTIEGIPNGNTYPIGLDPAWHGAENYLLFTNPYKMKQAIILGVLHMTFAICLQVVNHLHFRKRMFIWLEFVPQILFMESIFGYLVFCIMYKWSVDWYERDAAGEYVRNAPPNLLNMLIYMFLSPGTILPGEQLYAGQGVVQVLLLLIAVVCVPWMWFAKPYYLKKQHSMHQYTSVADDDHFANDPELHGDEDEDGMEVDVHTNHASGAVDDPEEEEFDFGEEMIHQTIHTIEFCLNCISNTASYLRLWALSLAHAQLSSVLWDMTLKIWFNYTGVMGAVGLVVGFAAWFTLTCFILIGMEGLSAFLHTLRLHWVEFDGKFYSADGYAFEPFDFTTSLAKDEASS
ncbi:V0/A0 complex, 116-kDa subunit of ATPase [Hesseltinella vesiculosa]|uniref:V-type proton ATPase subunit a n=1 Tax=Hesseltinella vesiculosa TaxID=101127 RepID=A0A1X2GGH2_9FUNG|nr:V0/A0 complex, 116-kDa subunit of ATPase [Hesseltinella vesiculosa]